MMVVVLALSDSIHSVSQTRLDLSISFPVLHWYEGSDGDRVRDRALSVAKIDREFNYRLDKIVNQRLKAHTHNLAIVREVELIEEIARSYTPPLKLSHNHGFNKRARADLRAFQAAEEIAESDTLSQIEQLLPQDQYERLLSFLGSRSPLDCAFSVKWLKLSMEQRDRIRAAQERAAELAALGRDHPDYLHAKYKSYSLLTPEQFKKAVVQLPEIRNWSLTNRLEYLTASIQQKDQIELTYMGEIYRQCVQHEDPEKGK